MPRHARKAKSKGIVTALAAVLVVLCVGAGALVLHGNSEQQRPVEPSGAVLEASAHATPHQEPQPTSENMVSPEPQPSPTEEPAPQTADIMLVGDLMCLSAQIGSARAGEGYDFTGSFSMVADIFAKADLAAGNLETCVAEGYPYAGPVEYLPAEEGEEPKRVMPVLNAPGEYLDALVYANIGFVSTAGNHCCDTGAEGIVKTIDALENRGIGHTGTFAGSEDERFSIIDINGIQVGFLAYTEYFNGKDGSLSGEEREYMVNRWSEERSREDIQAAREAGAEFIIVYTHWGNENEGTANGTQKEHAQFLAEAGADMIAGAHPHCLQHTEYIPTEDGRQVLCFYSLGNFVSSMAQQMHNDTVIASISLEKTNEAVSLTSASYIPCRVSAMGDENFVVQPVSQDSDAALRIAEAMGEQVPIETEE